MFQSRVVRRTRTSLDSDISPFVLDPSAVALQSKRSSGRYDATYLHTPATVTHARSHRDTLHICAYLDQLRHPHLEQFIGVITDATSQHHMIVTERQHGQSLAQYLSHKRGSDLTIEDVFLIGLQASRALHYLHQVSGTGHPALCEHSVTYDRARGKTVVLLTTECKICHGKGGQASRRKDVLTLAKVVLELMSEYSHRDSVGDLTNTQQCAVGIVSEFLKMMIENKSCTPRSMADLCKFFSENVNKHV